MKNHDERIPTTKFEQNLLTVVSSNKLEEIYLFTNRSLARIPKTKLVRTDD